MIKLVLICFDRGVIECADFWMKLKVVDYCKKMIVKSLKRVLEIVFIPETRALELSRAFIF